MNSVIRYVSVVVFIVSSMFWLVLWLVMVSLEWCVWVWVCGVLMMVIL